MSEPVSNDHQVDTEEAKPSSPEEVSSSAPKETNEVFLGGMVVGVLLLLLLVLIGTFGYFGFRLWKSAQVERSIPSIQELGEKSGVGTSESRTETPTVPEPSSPSTTQTEPPKVVDAGSASPDLASVEIKVLNGGAARGSAGTLVDILKKAGYTKAAFGNTVTDYTGTTIYYGANTQSVAEKVKELVIKTYPAVVVAPAEANNKDATAASVVVILGK